MPKYKVTLTYSAIDEIIVEAESKNEARKKAYAVPQDDWENIDYDEHDSCVEEIKDQ